MGIDFKAERNLGGAIKFYFIVFGLSMLVSSVFGALGGVLAAILVINKVVNVPVVNLGSAIGGILGGLSQLAFIMWSAVKVLKEKNIPFTLKTVGLIASIILLDFVPFTFGFLAFLVPAYFSMLPCNNDLAEGL